MRSFLGPALGALFFFLFRALIDVDSALAFLFWPSVHWLCCFLPNRPCRRRERLLALIRKREIKAAAMAGRKTADVLSLPPSLLRANENDRLALSARNLAKSFGGIHAVHGFDLSVRDKTLHALIGPNGAGKTTAFNVLSGLYAPDAGSVELEGISIAGLKPEDITRAGVGRSFRLPICSVD